MKLKIVASAFPHILGKSRPAGNPDLSWRYDANPLKQ
jgi:hypothetical protein